MRTALLIALVGLAAAGVVYALHPQALASSPPAAAPAQGAVLTGTTPTVNSSSAALNPAFVLAGQDAMQPAPNPALTPSLLARPTDMETWPVLIDADTPAPAPVADALQGVATALRSVLRLTPIPTDPTITPVSAHWDA